MNEIDIKTLTTTAACRELEAEARRQRNDLGYGNPI